MKTYSDAIVKRQLQSQLLKSSNPTIYGLAGPNADIYVALLKEKGFSNIVLFEKNWETYQMLLSKNLDCKLVFDDILNHLGKDAFYDYDFCCSIKTIEPWLPQILSTKEYSVTFSIRPVGTEETLRTFRRYGVANCYKYKDTTPMLTFSSNTFVN